MILCIWAKKKLGVIKTKLSSKFNIHCYSIVIYQESKPELANHCYIHKQYKHGPNLVLLYFFETGYMYETCQHSVTHSVSQINLE